MVFAIILAGGIGSRMGSNITKQRMLLLDRPLIWHTVTAFDECSDIDKIVVVSRADEIEYMQKELVGIKKLSSIVEGGSTRAESSYCGLLAVGEGCSIAAIHDAARCLITPTEISRVVSAARSRGAVSAAKRLTDTVKRIDESGRVLETLDRRSLAAMETPLAFNYAAIRSAFDKAISLGAEITDDNMIYENAGGKVYTIELECDNFKITTPRDLLLAELILKERKSV